MNAIVWSAEMALGIPELDREHEALIAHFQSLTDPAVMHDRVALRLRMDDLVGEVCAHFDHEERLMREHHFPDAAEHKDSHDGMLRQINKFLILLETDTTDPGVSVLDFVGRWLVEHIEEDDRSFGAFLRQDGRMEGKARLKSLWPPPSSGQDNGTRQG